MSKANSRDDANAAAVRRVRTLLEELAPAINAFKSEAIQKYVIERIVIPAMLTADVEATLEYLIAAVGRLLKGDSEKDIEQMSALLRALKAQRAVLRAEIDSESNNNCDDCPS